MGSAVLMSHHTGSPHQVDSGNIILSIHKCTAQIHINRGEVKLYKSDRGTNFVGATEDHGNQAISVEDRQMKDYLLKTGSTLIFNSPCSSLMGGAWERMIGSTKRILDSMLSKIHEGNLTHGVLATFMAEVLAIINNRPLMSVSTDAATPSILTPATLLTQKTPGRMCFKKPRRVYR